jgi:putative acyl-CoA dehydrogenase
VRTLKAALLEVTSLPREEAQGQARRLAGLIAVTLQAALLGRHAPAPVAEAFCASRLGPGAPGFPGGPGTPFGTALPQRPGLSAVLDRARAGAPPRHG